MSPNHQKLIDKVLLKNKKLKVGVAFQFSQLVLFFRLYNGMTPEQLAKKLKIGVRTLKRLEDGV